MNRYVIVSFLKAKPPVTFHKSHWPLHVTIIRPFVTSADEETFISALTPVCDGGKVMTLVGKSEEMFGPDNDIPVIELENTTELQAFRDEIMKACSSSITFETPEYKTYRPHVTLQEELKINVGENVLIGSLSLVKSDGDNRSVLHTIDLTPASSLL